jgi:subtilisin-like proprotein convertase family protein
MDNGAFDTLARSLTTAGSRRVLLCTAVAAVLGLVGRTDADAKRKPQRRRQQRQPNHDEVRATRHKKKKKKHGAANPRPPASLPSPPTNSPPPPPPSRQRITRTFSNTGNILIPDVAIPGTAAPYPSTIVVSGFVNGVITDVKVILRNLSHTYVNDVDILLAATHISANAIIMSDVGTNAVDATLTLDDQATAAMSVSGPLVSGTFKPTNVAAGDAFPPPAPQPTGNTLLSVFNGQNPNGTWQLFIVDDNVSDIGRLGGGWALQITAEVDA